MAIPLPASWTKINIVGSYAPLDENVIQGTRTIDFVTTGNIVKVDGVSVIPYKLTAKLLADGTIEDGFMLPATDDPDLDKTGWGYTVYERFDGGRRPYTIFVPYDSPDGEIDLADVTPVVPAIDLYSTRGPKGDKGDPGEDGDSAYQVALDNGFAGTEEEWLASLVGPKGDSGTGDVTNATVNAAISEAPSATRSALGLGTAATTSASAYATIAQGALAETAVQPDDLSSVATSGAYSDLSGKPSLATVATTGSYTDLSDKPTLGTAAAADIEDFDAAGAAAAAQAASTPIAHVGTGGTAHANAVAAGAAGFMTGADKTKLDGIASGATDNVGDVVGPSSVVDSRIAAFDGTTGKLLKDGGKKISDLSTIAIGIACSDETTALTTGTAKATFRMPFAFTVSAVRASVTTAPTGSVLTVDINETGTTILSTKLTIDATEKTSTTAATAAVISDTSLADDAEITIDIDGVGSTIAGTGLKVWLIGSKT